MNIVIAPDSYKESLSACDVAKQIELGFKEIFPHAQYIRCPIADGGEGTVNALVTATQGSFEQVVVIGPLGELVNASIGFSADRKYAFIEMAAASGLELVDSKNRNPLLTTSYGTGQLITYALEQGVEGCIVGLGGSATNDAGAGMLQALGVKLLDCENNAIGYGGLALKRVQKIDISGVDARLQSCKFIVACDVNNPLTGQTGASAVFGPQKGATPSMVDRLDDCLSHFAQIIQRDFHIDVAPIAGAGAAGGMGAAFLAFFNAELKPGIEIIISYTKLDKMIQAADLVITGEGRLDQQSLNGKVPIGIAKIARQHHKPLIAIAGTLGEHIDALYAQGIDVTCSVLSKVTSIEEALSQAKDNVYLTSRNIAATLKIGMKLSDEKSRLVS